MDASSQTRPSLLARLRTGGDHEAWTAFVRLYSPLVHRFAVRQGLQEADAADLAQEVFCSVMESIRRFEYDPERGSFRGWLKKIARCRLHALMVQRKRYGMVVGNTTVQELIRECPCSEEDDPVWEEEYRRCLFEQAARLVRVQFQESTWQAFWRTAVDHVPPEAAAGELGLSVGAVYIARSRVLARLRQEIQRIENEV